MQSPPHLRIAGRAFVARAVAICLGLTATAALVSAGEPGKRQFDVPADLAEKSLRLFSVQSGFEVLFSSDAASGVRTNAIKGDFLPNEAVKRMLAGTTLYVRDERNGVFRIAAVTRPKAPGAAQSPGPSDRPGEAKSGTRSRDPPSGTSSSALPDQSQTNQPHHNESHPVKNRNIFALIAAWLVAGPELDAQTTSAPPTEDVVTLSPFTVSAQEDKGYQASTTLAGSRLKTSLKDLAGGIQVVTEQFLQDTGSTDAEKLLVYTTNTEVAGPDGNFTGSNADTNDNEVRRSPSSTTRVRGLANADRTRGYFLTDIDFDAYNTDRITVSRGPNGMLFGLGSPGGIIDNSLKIAKLRDASSVQIAAGSYGAHREVVDINRVLVPKKAALRIIGLLKEDRFMQEESFANDHRIYGSLLVQPLPNTVFRANAEAGSKESSKPSQVAPRSNVPAWIAAGMPIRTPASNPALRWGNRDSNRAPQFVFGGPEDTVPIVGYQLGTRTPQSATLVVMNTWVTRDNEPDSSAFHRGAVMTPADKWIFDYSKYSLTGDLNQQTKNFNALNLALEQTFLRKRAGIELVYDVQYDASGSTEQAYANLQVDTSGFLPYTVFNPQTRTNDPMPNPNAGRLFLNYRSSKRETITDRSSWRVTGFYDLDLPRETKSLGWLGRHVFTGMLSNQSATARRASTQYGDAIGLETDPIIDANTSATANFKTSSLDRSVWGIRYLGAITAPGVSTVTVPISIPKLAEYSAVMWNRNATPNLPGELGAWQTRTISVIQNPYTAGSLNKDSTDSFALISQSYFLSNNLVLTAGWRTDKSKKFFDNDPDRTADDVVLLHTLRLPETPNDKVSGDAFSWGVVGHLPRHWTKKIGAGISVHFGVSENFQPLAGRVDILNRPIDNPKGETTEKGFSLDLLQSKVLLRVNWYETKSRNQTDTSLGTAQIPNFERLFYNNVRLLRTGPGEANEHWKDVYTLPPQGMMDAFWSPNRPDINTTTSVADANNPNVTGTSDFVSKGVEIEGTYNPTPKWSITFNSSSQEAFKTNVLKQYQDYLDIRNPQWEKMKHLVVRENGETLGSSVYRTAQAAIATERSKEGSILPEIRKWRFNLVSSYRFNEGRLKPWAIGGAIRWQDKGAVGYHAFRNEYGQVVQDIHRPIYGPGEFDTDVFVSYSRRLLEDRVRWKVQLNVYNVLNDRKEIPTAIDDDLVVVASRVQNPLTFKLSNTFEF